MKLDIDLWVIDGEVVYREAIKAYQWALASLGHRVSTVSSPSTGADLRLAIGAYWMPPGSSLPPGTIVLNFEHHPALRPHLPELYAGHEIWNYDPVVHKRFVDAGFRSRSVPFCWTPALSSYRSLPRKDEYDVIFVGSVQPERERRLSLLRRAGLRVCESKFLWGEDLARFMACSRVVLSMRSLEDSPFMCCRIYPAWAMGLPVLTDDFAGRTEYHAGIEQALAVAPHDDEGFVDAVVQLCHDHPRRVALGAAGLSYAKAHPMLPGVRAALEEWMKSF